MKTLTYQSPYLVPREPGPSMRQVSRGVWRRSLRLRKYSRRVWTGIIAWCLLAAVSNWVMGSHHLLVPGGLATTQTASAATEASVGVAELGPGPNGGLLPPGTLAAYGTYANSYSRGQCTWYVASRRQVPSNWGNANSWYYHAVAAHWSTGSAPAVGAIATTTAGYYGHVALVEQVSGNQVLVAEMNYNGLYQIDHRWTNAGSWRYIY
ncbi:CHAP domain-containing protein [Candidatus Saccharibacteria bacterium]|nr:CHAP domain-containing protein [Candidatus Saccharibacteria bacterium]